MNLDLSSLLADWPYEPGQINVRLIQGQDGEPKLQMRVDLGILQMELGGRPDGHRPNGYESLLDYFEDVVADSPGENRQPEEFADQAGEDARYLSPDDCRLLREEALQYYHRYIALLVLGDYEGVLRDTTRNMRALDLCRDYAEDEEDRVVLEQFRPYITMMRARAVASQAISEQEPKAAILAIDEGLDELRRVYELLGDEMAFEQSSEAALLRGMRDELSNKLPASQLSELRERLQAALQQENYELAAILRDELKMMRDDTPKGGA
ncbi:MAG: UvrB/UvrC motif-containing protein [Planctomycetota bacterium]